MIRPEEFAARFKDVESIDHVVAKIGVLLANYWELDSAAVHHTDNQSELLFRLLQACRYWLKKRDGPKLPGKAGAVSSTIEELRRQAEVELRANFRVKGAVLESALLATYGRGVSEEYLSGGRNADDPDRYITDPYQRGALKLCFRNGEVFRWSYTKGFMYGSNKSTLQPYSTAHEDSKSGRGWAIFVMGSSGRIYANTYKQVGFHHSYFLAGEQTYAAGEIRIEATGANGAGRITGLTSLSGHYKPSNTQMINVLERLHNYGVDLGAITVWERVRRQNGEPVWFGPDEAQAAMSGSMYLSNGGRSVPARHRLGSPAEGSFAPGTPNHIAILAGLQGTGHHVVSPHQ